MEQVSSKGMTGTSKPTIVMETLLFDLDGTLYPLDNGYPTLVVSERLVYWCAARPFVRRRCGTDVVSRAILGHILRLIADM